jgi:quercetin dioxygenase-like cupin family protein
MGHEHDRRRAAPDQRFAGIARAYDLAAEAESLRREASPVRNGHRQITLAHEGSTSLILFDFEAGGQLARHAADGVVTIHILSGRVRVTSSEGEQELAAGSLLVLSRGVVHDLRALVPSQVLLAVHLA